MSACARQLAINEIAVILMRNLAVALLSLKGDDCRFCSVARTKRIVISKQAQIARHRRPKQRGKTAFTR